MLWQDFLNNSQRPIHKWTHYFPVYEELLSRYRNSSCTLLEIGCGKGGSLQMWKRFLGPYSLIVGIDINEQCKKFEEDQINVEIGSQNDSEFLGGLIEKYGCFDIIVDDGSHVVNDVLTSLGYLFDNVSHDGVYIVEDLHTAYWPEYGGGTQTNNSFIEFTKSVLDALHSGYMREDFSCSDLTRRVADTTRSITIVDSLIAYRKGRCIKKNAPVIGSNDGRSNVLDTLTLGD